MNNQYPNPASLWLLSLLLGIGGLLAPLFTQTAWAAGSEGREILYWVAPMDPNYRRDGPGKSPMGMDLIPVYREEAGADDGEGLPTVSIAPQMINNLGVRTEPVLRGDLARPIETVGYIDYDANRVSHVHLRIEGWIERLRVRSVGERVSKGDLLFQLYSPQLVNAQEEYVQALQGGNERMRSASRERLLSLGVPEAQVRTLEQSRRVQQTVAIHARQDGVVADLKVREGMYVMPSMEVMTLADLASVWILVDVFERQAAWVQPGQQAQVRIPYLPGQVWEGQVEYIYPSLDPKTRTLKVRLRFDNPGEQLKPNMYAKVSLLADPRAQVLHIPREALIRSGGGERVVLARGEGRFQPVAVKAGIESGERIEILEGLSEGDTVAASAQFLIDSESSLKASFRRMSAPAPAAVAPEPAAAEPAPAPAAVDAVQAQGVVNSLDLAAGKLNITHQPIAALGWPAMTMDFQLVEGVSAEGLKAGAAVEFSLREVAEFDYRIIAIAPAAGDRP